MDDDDLEGSWLVEGMAWTAHLTWLSVLAGGALYIGLPPLVAVRDRFDNATVGTVGAIAAGAMFLAVSKAIFDRIKQRGAPETTAEAPDDKPDDTDPPEAPDVDKSTKKRKKKKKKKKGSRH